MQIYQSNYLGIEKQGGILVQKWTDSALSVEDYKSELLAFLLLFNQTKPKALIWDNRNCNLIIPEELNEWMGAEILVPIYKKGLKKLILTVPEKTSVHLSIINSLEKAKSILQPYYFTDVNEAEFYARGSDSIRLTEKKPIVNCQINADGTSFDLNVNVSPNDLPAVLSSIEQLQLDKQFIKDNQSNYESLTIQEAKIFKLIVLGNTNKQIGNLLFIEESSVKTHRKNIKLKLRINSFFDMYRYAKCFGIVK
jgi:DNA-binding CsgD family transcriptional regulator